MHLIQLVDKDEQARLMLQAYAQCLADSILPGTCHAFPSFAQIYDEYASIIIEQKTKRDRTTLDRDLQALTDDEFSVEYGFNPNEFGIEKAPELFNFLMMNNLTFFHDSEFLHDSEIKHCPLQEVW